MVLMVLMVPVITPVQAARCGGEHRPHKSFLSSHGGPAEEGMADIRPDLYYTAPFLERHRAHMRLGRRVPANNNARFFLKEVRRSRAVQFRLP